MAPVKGPRGELPDESFRFRIKQPGKMYYKAEDWSFEGLLDDRVQTLLACPPYSEIIRRIEKRVNPKEVEFTIDEGYAYPVIGGLRPLFYAEVGGRLADLFFNGTCGYRAQYYLSKTNGDDANRYAIQQIKPKLLEAARIRDWCAPDPNRPGKFLKMDEAQIIPSLNFKSAKIWGDESKGEMRRVTSSEGSDKTAQIIARRWVKAVKATKIPDKAAQGIKAPCLSALKFQGAFIKNGEERIACNKKNRSDDIYRYGWA